MVVAAVKKTLKESMNMPENRGYACTLTSQRKPFLLPANKV